MNKLSILIVFLAMASITSAQTQISEGNVSGTWLKSASPYVINGDISVPANDSLIIEPGVEVQFSAPYYFNVHGRLSALGTSVDSIRFTAADAAAGWKGMRFIDQNNNPNISSEIAFSVFSYGNALNNGSYHDSICGGAIRIINSSNITLRNSFFHHNSAREGGAIFIKNSSPFIFNSLFKNNTAFPSDYSDYEYGGGAIFIQDASPKILNSSFINNNGGKAGGAMSVVYDSNPVLKYLSIKNNTASNGGGMFFYTSGSQLTFSHSEIIGNTAQGIYVASYGQTYFFNLNISENLYTALRIEAGNVILENSILSNNNGAAAIYVDDEITVINCVLTKNISSYSTIDGPNSYDGGFQAIIMNSIIWDNDKGLDSSDPDCGIKVYYSDVQGGRADEITWGDGIKKVDPEFANSAGDNFHLSSTSSIIDAGDPDANYKDEYLSPSAGRGTDRSDMGAYGGRHASWAEQPTANFIAEDVTGGRPYQVHFIDKSLAAQEYEWDFDNNGTIDSREKNPVYTYEQAGNYAVKLSVHSSLYSDTFIRNNYINVKETHFSGNVSGTWDIDTAYIDGDITIPLDQSLSIMPGTYVKFTGEYKIQVEGQLIAKGLEDNKITFSSPSGIAWQGVRFWMNDENNQPVSSIENCIFTNSQYQDGLPPYYGTVYYKNTDAHISNSTFQNTSHVSLHRADGEIYGSEFINVVPLYIDSSAVVVTNCHFDSSGVSIQNSSPIIDSCIIEHSMNGGSITGISASNSSPIISNTIIRENKNGFYFYNSNPTLDHVTIENNYGDAYGGGGYASNSNVTLKNVIIRGNTAWQYGGGLFFTASSSGETYTADLENCLIVKNEIKNSINSGAGVVFWGNYQGNFTNCTIADNSAHDWAAIVTDANSEANLKNCIVYNNGDNLDYQAGGLYTYSIIQGNYVGSETATTNLQNVDPLFRDAENGDYHLQSIDCGYSANSPAIDTGDPLISDFMLDCASAGLGSGQSDIGAYGGAGNWWDKAILPDCHYAGEVSGVWECETIYVDGDILIPFGDTLRITDAVDRVAITGPYQIKVEGVLLAHGMANETTNLNGDQILFQGADWKGIYFNNLNETNPGTSIIENCRFDYANKMDRTYQGGGAIAIYNSDKVIVRGSVFYLNQARLGGAIYIENSNPQIENCYFNLNGKERGQTGVASAEGGGAMYVRNSNPYMHKLFFTENQSINGGGALVLDNSSPTISNLMLVDNTTKGLGGAIQLINGASPTIVNMTSANNIAENTGGTFYLNPDSNPTIINSIMYGDSKPEIYLGGGTPDVTYSIIDAASSESYFGTGCLDENPYFAAGVEYKLSNNSCAYSNDNTVVSPAIDAGHPDSLDVVLDCNNGLGTERADMGYYGGGLSTVHVGTLELLNKTQLFTVYPNPNQGFVTLDLLTTNTQDFTYSIYNYAGQLMETKHLIGQKQIRLDLSSYKAGIYLVKLEMNKQIYSKIIIRK